MIHLGLLEEALLIEDAPIITCANGGHRTRHGTFCESCGIALAALPASRSSVHSPRSRHRRRTGLSRGSGALVGDIELAIVVCTWA